MGEHRVHQYSEEYRQRTSEGDVGVEISYLDSVKKPKLLEMSGICWEQEYIHPLFHRKDGRNNLPIAIGTVVHLLMVKGMQIDRVHTLTHHTTCSSIFVSYLFYRQFIKVNGPSKPLVDEVINLIHISLRLLIIIPQYTYKSAIQPFSASKPEATEFSNVSHKSHNKGTYASFSTRALTCRWNVYIQPSSPQLEG